MALHFTARQLHKMASAGIIVKVLIFFPEYGVLKKYR